MSILGYSLRLFFYFILFGVGEGRVKINEAKPLNRYSVAKFHNVTVNSDLSLDLSIHDGIMTRTLVNLTASFSPLFWLRSLIIGKHSTDLSYLLLLNRKCTFFPVLQYSV